MKKPLPVKIVEALVTVFGFLVTYIVHELTWLCDPDFCKGVQWQVALVSLFPCLLIVGIMMSSIYRRCRALFFGPIVVFLFVVVWLSRQSVLDAVASRSLTQFDLVTARTFEHILAIAVCLLVSAVLLYLPPSNRWFSAKRKDVTARQDEFGCFTPILLFLFLLLIQICIPLPGEHEVSEMKTVELTGQGEELFDLMKQDEQARKTGGDAIGPSTCTNSTQFLQSLLEKYGECVRYTNIWCVAVNPPEDGTFPLLFTDNVDPLELLHPKEEKGNVWCLTRTCPNKKWGGPCFGLCEKAAVIFFVNGGWLIHEGGGIVTSKGSAPCYKPGPDTYFLTPTGRVDLVDRQVISSQGQIE